MYEKMIAIVPFIFCLIGSAIAFLFFKLFRKPSPFIGAPEAWGTVEETETHADTSGDRVRHSEHFVIYFLTPEGVRVKGTHPCEGSGLKIGDTVKLRYILDSPNSPAKKVFKNVFGITPEPSARIDIIEPSVPKLNEKRAAAISLTISILLFGLGIFVLLKPWFI